MSPSVDGLKQCSILTESNEQVHDFVERGKYRHRDVISFRNSANNGENVPIKIYTNIYF